MSKTNPAIGRDLATIAHLAATEWFSDFFDAHEEAGQVAAELVAAGSARLELHIEFDPARGPVHRLLLVPTDSDGNEPLEICVSNGQPEEPTPAALESRFWFFGRLSHWQNKH